MSDLHEHGDLHQEKEKKESTLLYFSVNITKLALENKLDPVIGREVEIDRVAQILSRRRKNNPVIIGEPGVGKSAIIEGLAQMIIDGTAPSNLLDKEILSLEIGNIVAGTKYRGQFEERMKAIIDELAETDHYIVFIDEIHTLVGAGGASGSLDAANILKPALSRGLIQCIGATTFDEYKNSIEKDGALERRFQKVIVEEPTATETREILENIKIKYEEFHHVHYTDNALDACVNLSERYISDRAFPDKAIDILDEAGSKTQIKKNLPKEIIDLTQHIKDISKEKYEAVDKQFFKEAAVLRDIELENTQKLETLKEDWKDKESTIFKEINEDDIRSIVSMIAKIPLEKLSADDREKYIHLESILKEKIIGQDDVLSIISKTLRRNKTSISNPNKPIGTFLFTGNTGVGKTETAKVIAEEIFGPNSLIRLDMSEYSEKINVSRLVGAAPGYVGYEEGGQLTEKVRRKPFSVILFDEIEKAHSEVFNILLQILDEGRLTDNNGRLINFRNTIIIMTSNVGVKTAQELGAGIGFDEKSDFRTQEKMKKNIEKELKKKFAPEFINRISNIITFKQLTQENISEIVELHLIKLKNRIKENGFKLTWNKKVTEYIATETYEPLYGARPVERGIQTLVEDLISEELLILNPPKNSEIKLKMLKNGLKVEIKTKQLLLQ